MSPLPNTAGVVVFFFFLKEVLKFYNLGALGEKCTENKL